MELIRFSIALILATIAAFVAGMGAMFLLFGASAPNGLWGYMYGITDMEAALSIAISVLVMVGTATGLITLVERYESRKWAQWRNEA